MKIPDLELGKRLTVGANPIPVTCFGIGPTEIRGTAAIQGPLLVGASQSFPIPNVPEASVMIARTTNPEAPVVPSILKVNSRGFPPTPIDVMIGDPTGIVGILVNSLVITILNTTTITITTPNTILNSASTIVNGSTVHNGPVVINGTVITNGSRLHNGNMVFNGVNVHNGSIILTGVGHVAAAIQSKKGFDISHPTKKNHRLRHICLEGPSAEVYFRGKLKDNNIIEIPEYWSNLVDIESIGINLTPITCYQELFVDKIESNRIIVKNNAGGPIHCSYVVYGERIDGEKNIPEYQGLTPNDYPGDNNEYTINGL